jgi:hypothetical protein
MRMDDVLALVREERVRQLERYGQQDLDDGTGPLAQWAVPVSLEPAKVLEGRLREAYEKWEATHGAPTWRHLVVEEVAEALQETDPARLAEELTQVAALCVSWVEALRSRHEEWGIRVDVEQVVTDPDWQCPADVMRSTHGFALRGPVTLVHRQLGEKEWKTYA